MHIKGGFCVGGTHNPTSTNASFAKRPDVVYTPLLEEFHRDTVSRVYFNSGTPFASEWCVCHIRDYDYSALSPQSTYILMPSAMPDSVESNHPESSESCETFLCYLFLLGR